MVSTPVIMEYAKQRMRVMECSGYGVNVILVGLDPPATSAVKSSVGIMENVLVITGLTSVCAIGDGQVPYVRMTSPSSTMVGIDDQWKNTN